MPTPFPLPAGALASLLVLTLAGTFPATANAIQIPPVSTHLPTVNPVKYQRWPDALLISNGLVEAVVVPAIGRVMQLRFAGESDGPFWGNAALAAPGAAVRPGEWGNYGGDKAWPAPQSDWDQFAGRGWPPPPAFDSRPAEATIDGTAVTLLSPIDPGYGIRVRRRIELAPDRPVMTVTTTYEKVAGAPVDVAVWVITQLKDPVLISAPLAGVLATGEDFLPRSEAKPAGLSVTNRILSLTRDHRENRKFGLVSATLIWVGATELMRIDSAVVPGAKYPDVGRSAQIYTNADPVPYVELELLGPLARVAIGDRIERTSTYTLGRRVGPDPTADVKRLLAEGADPSNVAKR